MKAANPSLSASNVASHPESFLQVPGVLYCLIDSNETILEPSPSWFHVLGYTPAELRSRKVRDLIHPDDLSKTIGDEPWIDRPSAIDGFTNRFRHQNGSYRWIRWQTQHRREHGVTYAIGFDITHATDAAGLKPDITPVGSPRTGYQILFESNPNPMWIFDLVTLRFLEVNEAAIEQYGYTRSEFLSMTLLDIRPAAERESVIESVRRHSTEDQSSVWTHILKDGRQIKVEAIARNVDYLGYRARLVSIKDVTDQFTARALLQHNNDVLEQRVAERTQELVAANTELEAFCFSVSHDLRAPLRAIDGFSHSVIKHYGSILGIDGRSDLERVRKASQKMSELIDALLGLARLTRQELRPQVVDLSAVAKLIIDELRAENPGRDVFCRIQPGMEVIADARLMHLLLQNLLANAWKFTMNQPQAEIVFEARPSAGELVYSIRDNGAGFDMAYSDKLFQPFQRLHNTSEYPGNGVGLATVNRIIARHGGRVFAHGLIDHGATIYFTLGPATIE